MLPISFSRQNKSCRTIRYLLTVLTVGALCYAPLIANAANMIRNITTQSIGSAYSVRIQGSSQPAYTAYELFNPTRIVVDVAGASLDTMKTTGLDSGAPFTLETKTVSDSNPALARFEFTFNEKNSYTSYDVTSEDNEIILTLNLTRPSSKNTLATQLPQVTLPTAASQGNPGNSPKKAFGFSGYENERISVDFYKIDLHNVFRFIREVSKMNVIVDESVSGSLTLSLNDVPWDFALDIILNLKDLQKIERYNTIVILPKKKDFTWPERAEDNLSFEEDEIVVSQEAIVIQQQMSITPEVVEAKKSIKKGRASEKRGNYSDAITAYSEAFAKWPDNDRLANKIASIYLVYLRQNAKAVHFAKLALEANSENTAAALNAAIGLANMQKYDEARDYFAQSVSTEKPASEALLSYAVFSEQQEQYDNALKLLQKNEDLYGLTLDSMIASARILDKQGNTEAATEKYKSILLSGYQIPPDLKKYIKSRIALNQSM